MRRYDRGRRDVSSDLGREFVQGCSPPPHFVLRRTDFAWIMSEVWALQDSNL